VRTEEAVLITLSTLSDKLDPIEAPPEFVLKDLIAQSEDTGHSQKFVEPMKRKNKVKKQKPASHGEIHQASEFSGESDNNVNTADNDMSRFD
jgi:hypothetical protein